jgi:hypothetical protein
MERELSKQQEAVLLRAQMNGGTCLSTTAYSALVDLGGTLRAAQQLFYRPRIRPRLSSY